MDVDLELGGGGEELLNHTTFACLICSPMNFAMEYLIWKNGSGMGHGGGLCCWR
jgi:hypothetical protein